MAFIFTVETGTGLTTSTSYCATAFADDYFEVQPSATAWAGLSDDSKEYYLSLATRFLDQKVDWKGTIASATQALRWPRVGAYTRDGISVGSTVIPRAVKAATCEMALYLITNDPNAGQDTDKLRKIVVDVIEIEYQEGASQPKIPSIINSILTGLGFFVAGGRGFGKIVRM